MKTKVILNRNKFGIFLLMFAFMMVSSARATTVLYKNNGMTVSERVSSYVGREELTTSPKLRLIFNKDTIFDNLNSNVIPDLIPEYLPEIFSELVDGEIESETLLETNLPNQELENVEDEEYSKPTDELIAEIVGGIIDALSLGFLSEKKEKKIEETIADKLKLGSLNLYLTYRVKLKNSKLSLNVSSVDLDLYPAGTNLLSTELSLPNLKVTGDLDVYAKAKIYLDWSKIGLGWLAELIGGSSVSTISMKLLDKDVPFTAKSFAINMDATLGMNSDTNALEVTKFSDLELSLGLLDIDDSDIQFIKQKIFDFGMDQFQDGSCKKNEDLEECISRELTRETKSYLPDMKNGINEAIKGSLAKALSLEKTMSVDNFTVASSMNLSGFTLNDGSPYIKTTWKSSFNIKYPEDSCVVDVPDYSEEGADYREYESGEGEADLVTALDLPEALIYAFVKSGELCLTMEYQEPTTGEVFEGVLAPSGTLTLGSGTYEGKLITWDNYDSFFGDLDPEQRYADSEESTGTTKSRSKSWTDLSIYFTESDDGDLVSKKADSTLIVSTGSDDDKTISKLGSLKPGYTLSVSTYTASGVQVDLPVTYSASKTISGRQVDLSLVGTLHFVGQIEPDENNEVYFHIKKAWVDGFSGVTDFDIFEVDLPDMTSQLNTQLDQTFYATQIKTITYYSCTSSNRDDYLQMNLYAVNTAWRYVNCEESCQIPMGVQVTELSSYDYTLRTDELLVSDDLVTLGLTTSEEVTSTNSGCEETYMGAMNGFQNKLVEDSKAMAEISYKITKWMAQEGWLKAQEELEKLNESYLTKYWDAIVINESPYPEDESVSKEFMNNFIQNVQVITEPTQVQTLIERNTNVMQNMKTQYQMNLVK